MTYQRATCTAESDGYHLHEFRTGGTVVTEHLHTWINEHLERWPDASRVYVGTRAYAGTAAEAWESITGKDLPGIDCTLADVTVVPS